MTKKTKLTRTLMAACSVVALSAVMYGCSSGGISDSDHQAALDKANQEAADQLAAEKKEAEDALAAEKKKGEDALAAEKEKAAEDAAAAEKMARATIQTNAITAAITAAETALGMVDLGATDTDIEGAGMAVQAATDAILLAVDVDDTSTYTTKVNVIASSLATAKGLVQQDRDTRKTVRAEKQKGAITTATDAANAAVALVVEGASNEVITAAGVAVQVATDAIEAAVDVDDTSTYTAKVDGIASSLMTAKDTVLEDRRQDRIELQTVDIDAAIRKAQSALGKVDLGASDTDISEAEMAVKLAKAAIEAAVDVDDTSTYTETVNGITSSLATAKGLVQQDRAAKKVVRAVEQTVNIKTAITAAEDALEIVDIEATDVEIGDARDKVQAVKNAILAAVDVDATSSYTAQIDGIEGRLNTAAVGALSYRAIQQRDAIDMAVSAAEGAVDMVGPDADADDVAAADAKVKALMDAIEDAVNVGDTSASTTTLEGLQNALSDRKTLRTAITDAMEALGDLDNDSTDDDIEAVQGLIVDAEDAIDAAANLSDDEKAAFTAKIDADDTGLQAMLDAEETTIVAARAGGVTMAKEAMARANGLAMALDAVKTTDDENVFGGADVTATHDGSKVTITPKKAGGEFKMQPAGPASVSGWTGQKFTRGAATDDTVEHLTVYTDIDAPKPMAFNKVNLNAALSTINEDVGGTSAARTYVLPNDNKDRVYDYVTWGSAAKPTIVNKTDVDSLPDVDSRSFTGYLAGATGKFVCPGTATECALTFNEKGMIATLAGIWTFTANSGAKVNVPDSEYLHFGWWIDRPAKAESDGTYSYGFQTFADGSIVGKYSGKNLGKVEGKATYNGAAAGVYVTKDISGGRITDATMGEFTAGARLSANFGNDSQAGVINGSISDFKDADGSAMAGWGVTLESVFLDKTSTFAGTTMGTTGPGATGKGSWEGTFHGDPAATDTSKAPLGVSGRFDAHLSGAQIAGGFGATR